MWGVHDWGWGVGMLLWMIVTWAVIAVAAWVIFRNTGGPRHSVRH